MKALNLGGTWSTHATGQYYGREIGRPGKAPGRRLWLSSRPQLMRDNVQIFEGSCFLSTWSFVLQVKCAHCLQSHRKIVCPHPTFPSIQLPFLCSGPTNKGLERPWTSPAASCLCASILPSAWMLCPCLYLWQTFG